MYQLFLHKKKKKPSSSISVRHKNYCTILHTRGFVKFIMLMPTKQSEGEHTILLALFTSKGVYFQNCLLTILYLCSSYFDLIASGNCVLKIYLDSQILLNCEKRTRYISSDIWESFRSRDRPHLALSINFNRVL